MTAPGENIYSWSTNSALNGNSDALINWLEGQARASVNNSARGMQAAHAKDRKLRTGQILTTGSPNAQAFSTGIGFTALADFPVGFICKLQIGSGLTNTGPVTLNPDGLSALAVKTLFGQELAPGTLVQGMYVDFIYNGTNWTCMPGVAQGQFPGTITNDDANPGMVGEYKSATLSSGSAVGLAAGTPTAVTNIALTPGDWDVAGSIVFGGYSGTVLNSIIAYLEPSPPPTLLGPESGFTTSHVYGGMTPFAFLSYITLGVGPCRLAVAAGGLSVYLTAQADMSLTGMSAYGTIRARRVR